MKLRLHPLLEKSIHRLNAIGGFPRSANELIQDPIHQEEIVQPAAPVESLSRTRKDESRSACDVSSSGLGKIENRKGKSWTLVHEKVASSGPQQQVKSERRKI